jgi:hypothetical protein
MYIAAYLSMLIVFFSTTYFLSLFNYIFYETAISIAYFAFLLLLG